MALRSVVPRIVRETPDQTAYGSMGYGSFGWPSRASSRRDRLIASSPVYFVGRLPVTEAHWGLDDPIVPPANGQRIRDTARARGETAGRVTVVFHAEGGHDLDPALARPALKTFLLGLVNASARTGASAGSTR